MNNEQLNLLRDFATWVRVNIGKSCNIEVNFWSYSSQEEQETQYRVWVQDIINKSSNSLEQLVGMIPKFKQLCELNMEVAA